MNISKISFKKSYEFSLPSLDKGINTYANQHKTISGGLKEGCNVIFEDGVLKNRPGFKASTENLLNINEFLPAENVSYDFCETECAIDSKIYKIATAKIENKDNEIICFFAIDKSGVPKKLGFISFNRLDYNTFYKPIKHLVFCGKSKEKIRIYVFVTLQNQNNTSQIEHKIYESSDEFGQWSVCDSEYIPTVYICGRGNDYESAKAANCASSLTPKILESPNLLNGRFYAYYSSEGFSSAFRLPYSNIAEANVICKIYYTPEQYSEWIIPAGETSAKSTFLEKEITATINREKGVISFSNNGQQFPIPKMNLFSENNIKILAQVNTTNYYDIITDCTTCTSVGAVSVFSGGIGKSRLFYSSYENPLYFREYLNSEICDDSEIFSLNSAGNTIFAFKEKEIYKIKIYNGDAINTTALLSDNNQAFFEAENFKIERISNLVGCSKPKTICLFKKSPIWFSGSSIYTLNSTKTTVIKLSDEIENNLHNTCNLTALISNGKYILFKENFATVMSFDACESVLDAKKVSFWLWKFPTGIIIDAAKTIEEHELLISRFIDNHTGFLATFKDENDVLPTEIKTQHLNGNIDIENYFKTEYNYFKGINNNLLLKNCALNIEGIGKAKIGIGTEIDTHYETFSLKNYHSKNKNIFNLYLQKFPIKSVSLTFETVGKFKFFGAVFNYNFLK